jgi:hypothetical protein
MSVNKQWIGKNVQACGRDYYPTIYLEGHRKITKILNKDSQPISEKSLNNSWNDESADRRTDNCEVLVNRDRNKYLD